MILSLKKNMRWTKMRTLLWSWWCTCIRTSDRSMMVLLSTVRWFVDWGKMDIIDWCSTILVQIRCIQSDTFDAGLGRLQICSITCQHGLIVQEGKKIWHQIYIYSRKFSSAPKPSLLSLKLFLSTNFYILCWRCSKKLYLRCARGGRARLEKMNCVFIIPMITSPW